VDSVSISLLLILCVINVASCLSALAELSRAAETGGGCGGDGGGLAAVPALLLGLREALMSGLQDYEGKDLSRSLRAFAILKPDSGGGGGGGGSLLSAVQLHAVHARIAALSDQLEPADVSQLLWAHASAPWALPASLLRTLQLRAKERAERFTAQGVASTLWYIQSPPAVE